MRCARIALVWVAACHSGQPPAPAPPPDPTAVNAAPAVAPPSSAPVTSVAPTSAANGEWDGGGDFELFAVYSPIDTSGTQVVEVDRQGNVRELFERKSKWFLLRYALAASEHEQLRALLRDTHMGALAPQYQHVGDREVSITNLRSVTSAGESRASCRQLVTGALPCALTPVIDFLRARAETHRAERAKATVASPSEREALLQRALGTP